IHEAFDIARRQLQDYARRQRGTVKTAARQARGRVSQLLPDRRVRLHRGGRRARGLFPKEQRTEGRLRSTDCRERGVVCRGAWREGTAGEHGHTPASAPDTQVILLGAKSTRRPVMGRPVAIPSDSRARSDRREIAGWLMYDWANSAFQTTVLTVLVGPYLTDLAQREVGRNGVVATLGPFGSITALSLFPYCLAISEFVQVIFLPFLGAIADYTRAKKRLMVGFCYGGVAATCLLFFI